MPGRFQDRHCKWVGHKLSLLPLLAVERRLHPVPAPYRNSPGYGTGQRPLQGGGKHE